MITKLEFKRQLFHIFLGVSIVLLVYFNIIGYKFLFCLFIAGVLLSLVCMRCKVPGVHTILEALDRKNDMKTMPGKGAVFYALGSAFAVLLFEKNTAMASIMILALGDSVSRLAGPYGYLKHPYNSEKFVEGIILGAVAAFFGAAAFVPWREAAAASGIAMFVEGIDLRIGGFKIDDNLTIPLISGYVITAVTAFF